MSIYISLCCIGIDQELVKTIRSAKENSSDPENIYIGIACTGNKEFYNFVKNKINEYGYSNITIKYFELKDNYGIYKARTNAASMYSGQDYFLQVDAHSFFDKEWDTFIVKKYEDICLITKNFKTVISGFPGKYGYYNKETKSEEFWYDPTSRWPGYIPFYYADENFLHSIRQDAFWVKDKKYKALIPRWNDVPYENFSKKGKKFYDKYETVPLVKICAAFMFGNKYLANNLSIEPGTLFWEEEIFQSINLIDNGFSLAYVGNYIPICHMYSEDIQNNKGKRTFLSDYFDNGEIKTKNRKHNYWLQETVENFINFFIDEKNHKKIKRYEKYIGFNLLEGLGQNPLEWNGLDEIFSIPNKFCN